jgi:hypothetical protein
MKQLRLLPVVLAVASFSFSLAASAQTNIAFTNNDGTFTFDEDSATGNPTYDELTLGAISNGLGSASTLTGISGLSAFGIPNQSLVYANGTCSLAGSPTACLGSISLTTGQIASGSITSSATFAPGGSFSVDYTGLGIIFTGSFSKEKWISLGGGTWTFIGKIMDGVLTVDGQQYTIPTAATVDLTTTNAGATFHKNKDTYTFSDNQGTTNFSLAPEPGSLVLFGSGLVAVGLLTRRRLTGKNAS